MLTIRQMRYFDALATTLHFGRAADLVHVSQPALSGQIMEMEKHLGVMLIERSRSSTILTTKGQEILIHVRAVLAGIDQLEQAARKNGGTLEGLVRIGIIPTVAPYMVPRMVPYLRQNHPLIEIELKEAVTDRLLSELNDGKLDAVVAALPVEADTLVCRSLLIDRFYMAVADNDDDVLVSPLVEADVDTDRLLLLEEGHCLRDQALAVCKSASRRSMVNFGATSMATLLQMVSHDMGMTLIPEMAVETECSRNKIRIIPFTDPQPYREIGLIWRRSSARQTDMEALADGLAASARETRPQEKSQDLANRQTP